eukprot:9843554-Alexandrium_andersonii.AAC.1
MRLASRGACVGAAGGASARLVAALRVPPALGGRRRGERSCRLGAGIGRLAGGALGAEHRQDPRDEDAHDLL